MKKNFAIITLTALAVAACASERFSDPLPQSPQTVGPGTNSEPSTGTPPGRAPESAAPAGPQAIRAANYAASCTKDAECVAIYEGDGCRGCRCASAAINRADFPTYEKDLRSFASCHHPEQCLGECFALSGAPAVCQSGRCAFEVPHR